MAERWLFKSAGRTASHCLLGVLEAAGYELCWTEHHRTDEERIPLLQKENKQVWYDHQRGWPNLNVPWQIVLIRRRDFRAQIISKILSQYTKEFVFFSNKVFEPKIIKQEEFDWTARFIIDCESEWIQSTPTTMMQVYREDIVKDAHKVCHSIGISVDSVHQSRFPINHRQPQSICANWDQIQSWKLPNRNL